MILEFYKKIYSIIIPISCLAYAYYLRTVAGAAFFLSVLLIGFITRYYEDTELKESFIRAIVLLYHVIVFSGALFLYQMIADGSNQITPEKTSVAYIINFIISVFLFIFSIINLIKYYRKGKDSFMEMNNAALISQTKQERQQTKSQLDDFMKKHDTKK